MERTSARTRVIAARHDSGTVARMLLLAVLLALSLFASAIHAMAANVPAALPYLQAATVVSTDLSSATDDGTVGEPCPTHGRATAPCSSIVCCSGGGCQAPMELVALAELFLTGDGKHALPSAEAAKPGSPSPDMFRPPILLI